MKTKILFIVFLFVCTQAWAQGDGSVTEITKNGEKMMVCAFEKVKDKKTIPLSQLVEKCELVQLEYTEDALFKAWFTTVTEKYIGVRQQGAGAYKLFDRSGKFLGNIGSVGQGPGEYSSSLYDDFIDDKNELVYLAPFTGEKIWVYTTSGKFVKEILSPLKLNKPKIYVEDDVLSVVHMAFRSDKVLALQFDVNTGKVINKLAAPEHLLVGDYNGEIFNTRGGSAFDFGHTNSDTLYHYDVRNNAINPVFMVSYNASEKPFRQYIASKSHYFTNVFGKGFVMTDPKTKTSCFATIVNDYYGNLPMPFYIVQVRNGYYVYNLEPGQLIEVIEKRLAESSCTSQDKEKLKKIMDSLDENDNNLVFVGKLK